MRKQLTQTQDNRLRGEREERSREVLSLDETHQWMTMVISVARTGKTAHRQASGSILSRNLDHMHLSNQVTKLLRLYSRVLLEKLIVTQLSKQFPVFTGPQGSLQYSQQPATGPHSKPDASSPHLPTLTNQPTNQPTNQLTL
jgi:hypothetical protein